MVRAPPLSPLSQLFTYSFTSRKSTSINISSLTHQIPGSLNSFLSLSFLLLMNLLLVKQNYSKTVSTITSNIYIYISAAVSRLDFPSRPEIKG